eukprot:14254171-Alexandrium_andersonii.AAC.1
MTENFLCAVEGRLGGDFGDLREARLLNRLIHWAPSGLKYEADPRHAEQLARDLLQSVPGSAKRPCARASSWEP